MRKETEVVVLGSGPGGYTAAFRAADLGKKVILVERYDSLGGVCLNVGCIPSKALLHAAKVIEEASDFATHGIDFGKPKIDATKLVDWKNKVVNKLTGGLKMLAKQRKVEVVHGHGQFQSNQELLVTPNDGDTITIAFEHAIIAAGSRPIQLPFLPHDDARIMDSTDALELRDPQSKLLIIGGGIIGLEMATIYHALGCEITIVEMMDQIIPGADKDIVTPLHKRIQSRYKNIYLQAKVTGLKSKDKRLEVAFEGKDVPASAIFDRILCAVGRRPNSDQLGLENAGIKVNDRGFIEVDKQLRTNVPHIFAIGDICGNPMLAHKAMPEGRVAAEVIAGFKHYFDPRCIASVAYTDPEVAWVGMTETEAKASGIQYGKGVFPWAASGRSLSLGRSEGVTKLLIDENSHRVIGGGIVGPNAGELIGEVSLAIEMGCDVQDLALTIHPHPTLSETLPLAIEAYEGTITDLYLPKKPAKAEKVQ